MIKEAWFDILTKVGLRNHHSWLVNLPSQIERIANFGCWSGCEPFALLWTLNAKEVMVVEKERDHIEELCNQLDIVSHRYPESLQGRMINYVCRDMTTSLPELPDKYYDLAYCEEVLYTLQENKDALVRGIEQMIRVVRPSGFIVAVESKLGAQFEIMESLPVRISETKDMSELFSSRGLEKVEILGCPPFTYCYRKRQE
jgi:hypothetical protein